MDWYDTVFEVIDMRSFSNLWYWIMLALVWSTVSQWVLGVPFDMIMRARRHKSEEAMEDLHDMVRVNVNRILYIVDVSGVWLLLLGSAFFTALGITAFVYWFEISQAVFLLFGPLVIVGFLSVRTARKIRERGETGDQLIKRLMTHRLTTQMVGVLAIFVAAMFGMYQNLYTGISGF